MSKEIISEKKDDKNKKQDEQEVEQELSQVARSPKQNMLILSVILIVFAYLFFKLFISSDDSNNEQTEKRVIPKEISKPVQISEASDAPEIPKLPTPPKLEDPTPPPQPEVSKLSPNKESIPELPAPTETDLNAKNKPALPSFKAQDENSIKRTEAKRKSSITLIAGTPSKKTDEQLQEEADFKYRGDMNLVLGKGKMIDAIIETAINTDLGGEIRAVISRDIYSEWGRNILIPKGSRVFGSFATGTNGAYGRVDIAWNRIDLISGYILKLSGTGTDALGRKGNQGRVDNKFKEKLANVILKSSINIAFAHGLDELVIPQISSQAAAGQSNLASSIRSTANGIFTQSGLSDTQKRLQICASVQAAITDKTSDAFIKIQTKCNSIDTENSDSTDATKLSALMSVINLAADSLLTNTTSKTEETKAQEASKKAFKDIQKTVQGMVEQNEFKPTITINQGTPVKIYVNKDFKFPKSAINRSRMVK
ncbi:TrbI/VirB10 family protein [Rickettsiaceae bacterium]|nr:TrbI/VirB10 family protein [Rickettsiaceae bacterium]